MLGYLNLKFIYRKNEDIMKVSQEPSKLSRGEKLTITRKKKKTMSEITLREFLEQHLIYTDDDMNDEKGKNIGGKRLLTKLQDITDPEYSKKNLSSFGASNDEDTSDDKHIPNKNLKLLDLNMQVVFWNLERTIR